MKIENPQPGWRAGKLSALVQLLKPLAVWQLQESNKKSKGGPNGGRKPK